MSSCMGLKLSYPKQAFNACLMSVVSGVMPLSFSRLQSYAIFPVTGIPLPATGLPDGGHRSAPERVRLCQPTGTGPPRKRTTRPSALPLSTRTTRPEAPVRSTGQSRSRRRQFRVRPQAVRQANGGTTAPILLKIIIGGVILDFLRFLRPTIGKKGFQMLFSS